MVRHHLHFMVIVGLAMAGASCGPPKGKFPAPSWTNDVDHDGIKDPVDSCKAVPEDYDGYKDADGCPEPDNDADGVVDPADECPNMDGDAPSGCPGVAAATQVAALDSNYLDKDGDGLPNDKDKCPDDAEDFDGLGDEDGCPEPDFDGDTIPDEVDKCPTIPEDGEPPLPNDGCKAPDQDGDGVVDAKDHCADRAGPASNNGCPIIPPCVGTWSGSNFSLSITSASSSCGAITFISGPMTCRGSLTGCSVSSTQMSASYSCTYDRQGVPPLRGNLRMACTSQSTTATYSVNGKEKSKRVTKR